MKGGRMLPKQHEIASIKRCLGLNCTVRPFDSRADRIRYLFDLKAALASGRRSGCGRRCSQERLRQPRSSRIRSASVCSAVPAVDRSTASRPKTDFLTGRFWAQSGHSMWRSALNQQQSLVLERGPQDGLQPLLRSGDRLCKCRWRHGERSDMSATRVSRQVFLEQDLRDSIGAYRPSGYNAVGDKISSAPRLSRLVRRPSPRAARSLRAD